MNRGQLARGRPFWPGKRRLAFAIALTVVAVNGGAHAETLTVSTFGVGQTRQQALDAALVQAIEQATGVKLQASRVLSEQMSSTVATTGESATSISETFQQQARQQSGGIIKSFEIVSVDRETDGFIARLRVDVERYSAPGLPTQDRRRIVIAPPSNLAGLLAAEIAVFDDAIGAFFVQTRRFAVLDRENDSTYRAEMALLKGPDVPVSETARIGQVLGTDYVLVDKIRRLETKVEEITLPVTRQKTSRTAFISAVDFAVVEIATRQVKWAGRVTLQGSGNREAALRALASELGERIVADIYPLRVVQILGPNSVVLNQGANTVKVGQTFSANVLGDMAFDPYTREPLGRAEAPIGTIAISRVDAKLSYGELTAGSLPSGNPDIVLRALSGGTGGFSLTPSNQNAGSRPKW